MRVSLTLLVFLLSGVSAFTQDTAGKKTLRPVTAEEKVFAQGNNYAIIIGVSNYLDGRKIPPLVYAHTDAERFYNFLLKGYSGKTDPNNIQHFIQKDASFRKIFTAITMWLDSLAPQLQKGDALYIFYSGHGVASNEAKSQQYLCYDTKVKDSSLSNLSSTIKLSTIKGELAGLASKENGVRVILITDACRKSEADVAAGISAFNNASRNTELDGYNEYLFFSSGNDKYSYETHYLQSGVFSYFLDLGLMGAADKNRDMKITISEVSEFVRRNVLDYTESILKIPNGQIPEPKYAEYISNMVMSMPPADTILAYKHIYDSVSALIRKGIGLSNLTHLDYAAKGLNQPGTFFNVKENEVPAISRLASLKPDSLEKELYDKMISSIERKSLVVPENNCAYYFFEKLKMIATTPGLLSLAKENLFAALIGEPQKLIDDYLEGILRKTTKDTFFLAFRELDKAMGMMSPKNPMLAEIRPKLFFLKARAYASSSDPKDWKAGMALIDSAIRVEPNIPYNYHTRGLLESKRNNFFKTIENYKKAVQLAPSWAYPLYGLAAKYFDIGEYDKSVFYARESIRKDSTYGKSYTLIGQNYQNVRMYDSAIYYYQAALRVDSTEADALYRLGQMAELLKGENRGKTLNKPEAYYQEGMKKNDIDCIVALGNLQESKKNYDSALYYSRLAYQKDSFDLDVIEDLAYLWGNNNQLPKADSLYRKTLEKMGRIPQLYHDYAYFCFQYYNPKMGDSLFAIAKNLNPLDPFIYSNQSGLWERREKNYNKASAYLKEGLKAVRQSARLSFDLAQFYYRRLGDSALGPIALDSSLYYYRRSLAIVPDFSKTLLGLYSVFKEKKMEDSAIFYLRRACEQNKYIQNDISGPELFSLSMDAIKQKKFATAISILESGFINVKETPVAGYALGLCYYLTGILDKADLSLREIDMDKLDKNNRINVQELNALILFDKKEYEKALEIFNNLDENIKSIPDYLGAAVCQFVLGRPVQAKELLGLQKTYFPNLVDQVRTVNQTKFSANFIIQLNKLLEYEK